MRKSIIAICVLILAICFWLLFHKASPAIGNSTKAQTPLTNEQMVSQQSTKPKNITEPQTANVPSIAETHPRPTQAEISGLQQQIITDWQRPINFYGKVVDENTNPVVDANITFHWMEAPNENGNRSSSVKSDTEGLFSLTGAAGPTLSVSIGKNGYYTSRSTPDSFRYNGSNPFQASQIEPVVFYLRKKGKGESLIENNFPPGMGQIWQFRHDGTPINLDLLNGSQNVNGSGQLKLEFLRDISDMKKQPFDWKLQITALGGGLVSTDEEFPFAAPETNYPPSAVIDMPATNQIWLNELRTNYYIQLPNGDYGRFDLYLLPRNGAFTIKSWVNPSGSKNLEPAP